MIFEKETIAAVATVGRRLSSFCAVFVLFRKVFLFQIALIIECIVVRFYIYLVKHVTIFIQVTL